MSVSLALVLRSTPVELLAIAGLGALVGIVKLGGKRLTTLQIILPAAASFAVAIVVFLAVKHGLTVNPVQLLIPPLITFLPGRMLATAMAELTAGEMVWARAELRWGQHSSSSWPLV